MSHPHSSFLSLLSESATIAMSRKSRELRKKGVDVINLSLGEPDFDTPDFIKGAANRGMEENYTHYMSVNGYEDFRVSIAKKFKRDNNLNYTSDQIVVSTGAKQTLANIILALVDGLPIPLSFINSRISSSSISLPAVSIDRNKLASEN